MHVGFDISQTGSQKAGCGYFADALIKAMMAVAPQNRYSLFPSFGDFYFDAKMPILNPYRCVHARYGPRHRTRDSASAFWNQTRLENAIGKPDIVHCNNFWTPTQITSSRLVYTLYDLGFVTDADWTTEVNRAGCFEGIFRSSVAADWIIAISESSRRHYLNVFPHFPSDRIRVVPPCSRFTDTTQRGIPPAAMRAHQANDFWLSVGAIEPRKNQRLLVQAYARYLEAGGRPMPLVMAGGKGWLMDDFQNHLSELGILNHVKLLGYVTDDEMIWLYRNCYANLYPSVFEGFGLPVLEGMQFGAPTISSNATSMPEVAGDAAILISPHDSEAWTQNMLDLASDAKKRRGLGASARERAQRFNWQHSAASVLGIYQEAVNLPKRRRDRPRSLAPMRVAREN
jgi:glycosyltransferase involved in cell wall biosynthesis